MLSIFGTHSIALPLSPAFPAHELQYILDQSEASMLLSSSKFESKAQEVMNAGLEAKPKHVKLEKKLESLDYENVTLEGPSEGNGGMMLYTSGTTNRPVSPLVPQHLNIRLKNLERGPTSPIRLDSTVKVLDRGLGLQFSRSSPSRPSPPSHSRDCECHSCPFIFRFNNRVSIPL